MVNKCKKGYKKVGGSCKKINKSSSSKKRKGSLKKLTFIIISFTLALFFLFKIFHNWANSFFINLHFCDHTICIIFSLIWFAFGIVGLYFLIKKKEMKKIWYIPFIIILIVGIILMNLTYCDGGKIHFEFGSLFLSSSSDDSHTECTPGVDCAGDIVEVPIPPCMETDSGRDYITFGTILSGANLDDLCMGDVLRERYCNSELTYTSEDIDCKIFGAGWTCEEGECRAGTPAIEDDPECTIDADCPGGYECLGDECFLIEIISPESNCGDGIDNDGDGSIDCADTDCSSECGDFDYSCQHISPYPTCGGTCPTGEECIIYNSGDGTLDGGWCECMPEEETACYESDGCSGWCDEGYLCTGDSFGCFCEFDFSGDCEDTDGGIDYLIGGFSIEDNPLFGILNIIEYCGWEKGDENTLYEYYCIYGEAMPIEIDCTTLGLICIEDPVNGSYCGEGVF